MAKTIIILNSVLISLVCMSKPNPLPRTNTNNTTGFSMDLIHIDSPQSPYHDPSLAFSQTVLNAIRRSLDRLNQNYIQSTETDVVRSIHSGDYLMKYAIGIPPVPSLGIMDTGSDLIWTQCYPCRHCLKQSPPLYRPLDSSMYGQIMCTNDSIECKRSTHTYCSKWTNSCIYSVTYGDATSSWGKLSRDTFVLASAGGTSTWVSNIIFGCGYKNNGTFYGQESGIVGLGRGNYSLVAQLGSYAQGKFSYCLVSRAHKWKTSSKLNFGDNVDISGEGVVSTPLVLKHPYNFYFITLLGFSVGTQRLLLSQSLFSSIGEGNMFLDSGTTITTLPDDFYDLLKETLQAEVKLKQINDPKGLLDLCFNIQGGLGNFVIPTVTFHFRGADLKLEKDNIFVETSRHSLCLAVLREGGQRRPGLLGYIAQSNFTVAYDLEKGRVYFKPTDCTKL